jgi:signal transduction histidine kinase/CheY-like chemotaxis protein
VPEPFPTELTEFARLPIPGGVCALDGTILDANAAAEELLGRTRAELIGRKAWDIAPGADLIWNEVIGAARVRGVSHGEIAIATPQAPKQIDYLVAVREHAGESYVMIFAHEHDGDRLSAEATYDAKLKLEALGLVAGGIAHDFNNQLVSVLAEASAAREDAGLAAHSREALRRIEAAAHRMAQLTRQLLAYAGRGRFVTELLDPDELVRQTQEQLFRAVGPDARLELQLGTGRVAVEADRALLRQVVVNLVANASEALADGGGAIGVATQVDGAAWLLRITDTGRGMDPETAARIFDPFFTTKPDRHGLGLSAVHGIVRRLGGAIAVDSKPGRGTTISVRLPIIAGVEPERRRPTSVQLPLATLRGIRILVADDEPSVRATVKRLLERRGADVVLAADGAEAEARLGDGIYQVVLFDVMMPQLTGYELVPLARRAQPGATVMLMSGYTDLRRGAGGEDEPDAFLEKPFTAKVLDRAMDDVLARLR